MERQGPQAGGPMRFQLHGGGHSLSGDRLWQLHAPHALARRSTGASCSCCHAHSVPCASGPTRAHAFACTMRAARGGALDRPLSGMVFGGVPSGFCLPSLTDQPCPVDSADGAGQLQLWSALLAAISTSSAGWSGSLARQSAIAGCWRSPSRSELLACAGGRDTALWGGVAC